MRIAIVAGETSGDVLGAGLMRALKVRLPEVQFEGIGGPRMQKEGCLSFFPMEALTIMGFEGLRRVPGILRIRRALHAKFCANPPDLYIGVDVPDFNLTLEERLRRCGVTTVHYVSPTVWAWRGYRIRQIRRAVDHMLTLFPFEADYYRTHNVAVSFVGHPLADVIPENYEMDTVREELGLPRGQRIVALLPGSRVSELRRHAELFVDTAIWLAKRHPNLKFAASFVDERTRELFERAITLRGPTAPPIKVLMQRARHLMAASDVVLAASGTVTLEGALLKKPMVVTYKVSWLTYWLVRMFAHVRHFSLPNNLAGREIVPELLQEDARADKLGPAVERYLVDAELAKQTSTALGEIYHALRGNANDKAADAVMRMLPGSCAVLRPTSTE